MNLRIWVAGLYILGMFGCAHHQQQARLQAEDEDKVGEVQTIGDVTTWANADDLYVAGIGLIVDLEGTGGGVPPAYKMMILEHLQKDHKIENPKALMNSSNTAVVQLMARVPAGCRKGDVVDIEVTVPRDSKTTSLRGGRLLECWLSNYDTKSGADPAYKKADGASSLKGHPVVRATGPLVVGFGSGDESLRQAKIWGGGKCRIDRPYYLVMNSDKQYAAIARAVAERINETFHGPAHGGNTEIASAKTKTVVYLGVPPQYRLNQQRYLRVVRLIPMRETGAGRIAYRRKLEQQLLDPKHAVTAALRLEALAQDSIPTLKRGLASEHPLVRFTSAESLAYLGSSSCGEELARCVREQPALRAFSLTALASLDEAVCHVELKKLLESESPEVRYGALRALRALDENDEVVQGELMNESFWLLRVPSSSQGLVHLSSRGRAEVVLFGEEATLLPRFSILAGEFTVTAATGDDRCTISRISVQHGQAKRQCSLKIEDMIRTLSELGGTYAEVVEVMKQAEHCRCLSTAVAVDALPQATDVVDLAKAGAGDGEMLKTHPEIMNAKADFGATPTLFDKGESRATAYRDEETALKSKKSKNDKKTADREAKTKEAMLEKFGLDAE